MSQLRKPISDVVEAATTKAWGQGHCSDPYDFNPDVMAVVEELLAVIERAALQNRSAS